jgi:hypothetical protein
MRSLDGDAETVSWEGRTVFAKNMQACLYTFLVLEFAVSLTDQLCIHMYVFVFAGIIWISGCMPAASWKHVQQSGMLQAVLICKRSDSTTHIAPALGCKIWRQDGKGLPASPALQPALPVPRTFLHGPCG